MKTPSCEVREGRRALAPREDGRGRVFEIVDVSPE